MQKSNQIKIYSFDIFDTTVTRAVARPEDLWLFLQERLRDIAPGLSDNFIQEFPCLRRQAENQARWRTAKEEITLTQIYARLAQNQNIDSQTLNLIQELELALELKYCRPIAAIIEIIKQKRREGFRIIFTSDMYLPGEHLKNMLTKADAWMQNDGLYVSAETGLSKLSGNLYRYILENEHCRPDEICHYGDNFFTDIWLPHKLGIKIPLLPSYRDLGAAIFCQTLFGMHKVKQSIRSLVNRK